MNRMKYQYKINTGWPVDIPKKEFLITHSICEHKLEKYKKNQDLFLEHYNVRNEEKNMGIIQCGGETTHQE